MTHWISSLIHRNIADIKAQKKKRDMKYAKFPIIEIAQVTDDIPINGRPLIRRCRRIFFGIERWSL